MTWHNRSSPHNHWPSGLRPFPDERPKVIEETLEHAAMVAERKNLTFTLKENPRGRFLRIVESCDKHARHSKIIIPSTGLEEFRRLLEEMIEADRRISGNKRRVSSPEAGPTE